MIVEEGASGPHDSTAVCLAEDSAAQPSPIAVAVLDAIPSSIPGALALARKLAAGGLLPGNGATLDLWECFATLGACDLGTVRAAEPHLDAAAIFDQAGITPAEGSWGVFAAEGGDAPVTASAARAGWLLTGTKAWCSLAPTLDHALVTARVGEELGLFAVDLASPGISFESGSWHARGLVEIASEPVRFDAVSATPVGAPGWYLSRPGFAWGGIGVAACWYGGAVGIARAMFSAAGKRPEDPVLLMHLGAVDVALQSARRALAEASRAVDDRSDVRLLARRVRATVARACEDVIIRSGHSLGPAALAHDKLHAKRVADLTIYIRQHHAERDEISLGRSLAEVGALPW